MFEKTWIEDIFEIES